MVRETNRPPGAQKGGFARVTSRGLGDQLRQSPSIGEARRARPLAGWLADDEMSEPARLVNLALAWRRPLKCERPEGRAGTLLYASDESQWSAPARNTASGFASVCVRARMRVGAVPAVVFGATALVMAAPPELAAATGRCWQVSASRQATCCMVGE